MTPQGRETWEQTAVGPLVTRDVNPRWLIAELVRCGFRLVSRQAGEWTQSYTVIPGAPVRWLSHRGNAVWYRSVRIPYSAQGQLFVFPRHHPGQKLNRAPSCAVRAPVDVRMRPKSGDVMFVFGLL